MISKKAKEMLHHTLRKAEHGLKLDQDETILLDMWVGGEEVTSWGAIAEYKITRLAAIIHRLKGYGFQISSEMRTAANGKRYKAYWIERGSHTSNDVSFSHAKTA